MLQAQCTLVDITNCKACVEAPRPQLPYEHVTTTHVTVPLVIKDYSPTKKKKELIISQSDPHL